MSELNTTLSIDEIIKLLPHRYPFLLVDRVLSTDRHKYLHAIKNVTMNEPCFTGHFPGNPVMPGVLMIEAIAQAGALLAYLVYNSTPKDSIFYLASLDNAKFKQIVKPGDQLHLKVNFTHKKGQFLKLRGEATVGNKVACSLDIMSVMKKVNS